MKATIGNYPNRWICNIHTNHMERKYGFLSCGENLDQIDYQLEYIEDAIQWVYNHTINLYLDRKSQKVNIRIDKWDTWSMDHTLAPIILPMLIQLKKDNHGAPSVNMKDVPKELRSTKKQLDAAMNTGADDPKHFKRWDWIMDEMIWAFEQKSRDHWEGDYYKYEECTVDDKSDDIGVQLGFKLVWEDREGREVHQDRMANGFRLFGTYYEALWD